MISRNNRFHGYNSLRHVYKHGKTVRGPISSLKYLKNSRRKDYRLAIVVAKKVNKSAVVRNRIRRRLYEAIRRHGSEITVPYDMVLTVYHDQVATMPAEEIEKTVANHLGQAGIINEQHKQKA